MSGALAAPGGGGAVPPVLIFARLCRQPLDQVLSYEGSSRFTITEISLEGRREETRAEGGRRTSAGRSNSP